MSTELMLIIEVDGITHTHEATIQYDKVKQAALEHIGFTVLRFTDDEVLEDINGVRKAILGWIESRVSVPPP